MSVATLCGFLSVNHNQPVYPENPGRYELVRELMMITGFADQTGHITLMARYALLACRARIKPRQYQILKTFLNDAYRPRDLKQAITERLAELEDAPHLGLVLEWHRCGFSKKITRLEKAFSTPKGQAKYQKFVLDLKNRHRNENRLHQLRRIDRATQLSSLAVELQLHQKWIGLVCMDALLDPSRQSGADRIRNMLEGKKPEFLVLQVRENEKRLEFLYAGLTDAELDRFLAFLESDAGLWLFQISREILIHIVMDASFKLTTSLASALPVLVKAAGSSAMNQ